MHYKNEKKANLQWQNILSFTLKILSAKGLRCNKTMLHKDISLLPFTNVTICTTFKVGNNQV